MFRLAIFLMVVALAAPATAQVRLTGAFLPDTRTVRIDETATIFGTAINYGTTDGEACFPYDVPTAGYDGIFEYTAIGPDLQPIAPVNTPVPIAAGQQQNFVLAFRRDPDAFISSEYFNRNIQFQCSQGTSSMAAAISTMRIVLRHTEDPVPNIIAVGATPSGDQVMRANRPGGWAVMAVAATNLGDTDEISVYGLMPDNLLQLETRVCETNAAAQCLDDPIPVLQVNFEAGSIRTFNLYVRDLESAGLPYLPELARMRMIFGRDIHGLSRTGLASTHAAFVSPADVDSGPGGIWNVTLIAEGEVGNTEAFGEYQADIVVVPRPEPWADQGPIMLHSWREGPAGGNRRPQRIQFADFTPEDMGGGRFRFRPEVELGWDDNSQHVWPFDYPDPRVNLTGGILQFGGAETGRTVVSGNWSTIYRTESCDTECGGYGGRYLWRYRLQGFQMPVRNREVELASFTDYRVQLNPVDVETFEINDDRSVTGRLRFPVKNSGWTLAYRTCTFSGRIYETVPGAPAYYLRLNVVQDSVCRTDGFPPVSPAMHGEYEGIVFFRYGPAGLPSEGAPIGDPPHSSRHTEYNFVLRTLVPPHPEYDVAYYPDFRLYQRIIFWE